MALRRGPPRRFEPTNQPKQRINDMIRVPNVHLIDHEGTSHGVVPTDQAREMARAAELDLVEVAPSARPPVCKIMDYGKFRYHQSRKQRTQKGHQSQIKEIRLRPKTDTHDMDVKCGKCREFLDKGDKVLVNMIFRGREFQNKEFGEKTMLRFAELVSDVASIESPPKMQGRRMQMTLCKKK